MKKEELSTLGQKMQTLREAQGLSQRDLGLLIGVTNASISRYEKAEMEPRRSVIEAYARYFRVSPLWLLGLTDDPHHIMDEAEAVKIPVLGSIAAGQPIAIQEDIIGYVWATKKQHIDFALKVCGDSMINARIMDGDIVLMQQQPTADHGEIVAALVDGDVTLKRLLKADGYIILHPENPAYKDIVLSKRDSRDIRILGKVKYNIMEVL
jgi:repressor LexA